MSVSLNKVELNLVDPQSGSNEVYFRWTITGHTETKKNVYVSEKKSKTKKYTKEQQISTFSIVFRYSLNGIWYVGETQNVSPSTAKSSNGYYTLTYTPPEHADKITASIAMKPATWPKRKNKKKVNTKFFQYKSNSEKMHRTLSYNYSNLVPAKPNAPEFVKEENSYKLSISTDDRRAKYVQYQIFFTGSDGTSSDAYNHYKSFPWEEINWDEQSSMGRHAVKNISLSLSDEYTATCQFANSDNKDEGDRSEWSEPSSPIKTAPNAPTGLIATINVNNKVDLSWSPVDGVSETNGYTIRYVADDEKYFDTPNGVSEISSSTNRIYNLELNIGHKWFFQVRSNSSDGSSPWSSSVAVVAAKKPAPPTTWTFATNYETTDDVDIYWIYNNSDESKMSEAIIEYWINDVAQEDIEYVPVETGEQNPIYSYRLIDQSLQEYYDGTIIRWRIKTKGVHADYSEYSVEREIKLYSPAAIQISCDSEISTLPLEIEVTSTPQTQSMSYLSISIKNTTTYAYMDVAGNDSYVVSGTELYSDTVFPEDNTYTWSLNGTDISLASNQEYVVAVKAMMNSGLEATNSTSFTVIWEDASYDPDANVNFDYDGYTATISPFCYDPNSEYIGTVDDTTYDADDYIFDEDTFVTYIDEDPGNYDFVYSDGWTLNGESADISLYGVTLNVTPKNGDYIYLLYDHELILDSSVTLDVYRMNNNGTFTLISSGIENDGASSVIDPHPGLRNTYYRIIARSTTSNNSGYTDVYGSLDEDLILIQWDEHYNIMTSSESLEVDDERDIPVWNGSLIELPYNIKTSENNDKDVSLINYIGRADPVSYYGTQRGTKLSLSTEVPKTDSYTLAMLRQLDLWTDDVYIRDPNGNGYWANISITMSIDYDSLTVPVSIDVTKVDKNMI